MKLAETDTDRLQDFENCNNTKTHTKSPCCITARCWTLLVELSTGPAAQSKHHLRTIQMTELKGHLFREA